jgi:hypothetical protein
MNPMFETAFFFTSKPGLGCKGSVSAGVLINPTKVSSSLPHPGFSFSENYSQVPCFSYCKRSNENQTLTVDKISQTKAKLASARWFVPANQKTLIGHN